ncbi:MAG: CHRD domain-containing protein [Nitrososphaerota archaeon]
MERRSIIILAALLTISIATILVFSINTPASPGSRTFTATLTGFNEVPSVVSKGYGWATVRISEDGKSISYELVFFGLADVSMAHIHIGKDGHVGGVAVWLCGGPKPACPTSYGRVTGTLTASDVQAIAGQGLAAGDLDAVIGAIRAGAAYVNVHTARFPTGEIRGQLTPLAG